MSTPNCVMLGDCRALCKSSDSISRRALLSMSSSCNVNILSVDLVSDWKSTSISSLGRRMFASRSISLP